MAGPRYRCGPTQKSYLEFNINALKNEAVHAVDGAKSVTEMIKFIETDFSKIFRLTLDNGRKVIARLPTPNAGPAGLVTASQVATSEFARQNLGLAVPRTLAWSADRDETDVGAEFIIEEHPSGFELSPFRWIELSRENKLAVAEELWKIDKTMLDFFFFFFKSFYGLRAIAPWWSLHAVTMFDNPSPASGSIFFRDDVDLVVGNYFVEVDDRFVVGPSMRT